MKKLIALLLAVLMVVSAFAACGTDTTDDPAATTVAEGDGTTEGDGEQTESEVVEFAPDAEYVYKDAVGVMATNWNPHTYQTQDDSYPTEFIRAGFYSFIYNATYMLPELVLTTIAAVLLYKAAPKFFTAE